MKFSDQSHDSPVLMLSLSGEEVVMESAISIQEKNAFRHSGTVPKKYFKEKLK